MTERETDFLVYRYEADNEAGNNHELTALGRLYVRHAPGEAVTREMVRVAMENAVDRFPAARYRLVPVDRYVDVTVEATVILP